MYKLLITTLIVISCEIVTLKADNNTMILKKGNSIILNGFKYDVYKRNGVKNREVVMLNGVRYELSGDNEVIPMEWEEIHHPDTNQTFERVDSVPTYSTLLSPNS